MANVMGLLSKYYNIPGERFFRDAYLGHEYAAVVNDKMDTVLDIGACAGEFSAYVYEKAKIIYAIEPFPEHFAELKLNVSEFGLDKIKPFDIALSDYDGEGTMTDSKGRGSNHLAVGIAPTNLKVKVQTLATFIKEQQIDIIDLIKIDIEGGEKAVLFNNSAEPIIKKTRTIIGEHLQPYDSNFSNWGFKLFKTPNCANVVYRNINL